MQAAFDERPIDPHMSRQLWWVYRALVEYEHGDRMDDDKYRDAIRVAGEAAAEIDQRFSLSGARSMRERLTQGLTDGTSDSDLFNSSYANALVAMAKPKQSLTTDQ